MPRVSAGGVSDTGNEQICVFDDPEIFMDHDGISLGKPGTTGRADLAMYTSFTARNAMPVLWYPDRKFFLLGKRIVDRSP